ncbi:uncharacterized protein LOC125823227 [Solanum verrucosum]|uniref:uncharacterized protein LOC125823227 n=1 Tax=Solanum verrucosum TaxID=315347 RepID=UPI0020D1CCEA|nr:uncharacterized protein LOC125823227 [Solanum verrucosum]
MSEDVGDSCQTNKPSNTDLHQDDIDDENSVSDPTPLGEIGAIRWNHPRGEGPRRYFQELTEHDDYEEYQNQLSHRPTSRENDNSPRENDNSPRVNDLLTQILEKVEGSDDLLKGMRDDFSSLNSKVNSHANAIKMLEGQLNLLSAKLTTKMPKENGEEELTLSINLPLVEALLEMPGYAKFMKELVTKKRILEYETIEVPYSCSVIVTMELITKRDDHGAFTIQCTIGMLQFAKALSDLGVSIILMPYAIYKQLGFGEPKATTMRLLMEDRSIKHPVGILYDILVKVDRYIFLADFVILDCDIDVEVPIILGRPFLATGRALVVVESDKLKFRVNDDEVSFNICKSMKQPSDIHLVSTEDVIDEAVASVSYLLLKNEPLESILANHDDSKIHEYDEMIAALIGLGAQA